MLGTFIAGLVLLLIVLEVPDLGKDEYCCYPDTIPAGSLGRCDDPSADILSTPGRVKCPSRSWTWEVHCYTAFFLLFGSRNLIYIFDYWFQKDAEHELATLRGKYPYPRGTDSYFYIPTWKWRLSTWSPGAFVFGSHNYILGHRFAQKIHIGAGAIAVIFTIFFRYITMPLDEAWGCYGYVSADDTNLGMCTDPRARAANLFTGPFIHTPIFWWTLSFMVFFYLVFVTSYFFSIINIRQTFVSRVEDYRSRVLKNAPWSQ